MSDKMDELIYDIEDSVIDALIEHPVAIASIAILALLGGVYTAHRISKKVHDNTSLPNYVVDEKRLGENQPDLQDRRYTEEEYQRILRDAVTSLTNNKRW